MDRLDSLADRIDALLDRLEPLLPAPTPAIDWSRQIAARWVDRPGGSGFEPVAHRHPIDLAALQHIERARDAADRNTRQFLSGLPANNILLSGARGTGKSSLIKALLNAYADRGLRLVEVQPADLIALPRITAALEARPERFILFCDDLSFEADDPRYKALKAALDGSVAAPPDNLVIYATSNRRHLLPESFADNEQARPVDGEIHPGEAVEEKISLSERFGLWLSFQPFDQNRYLDICAGWIERLHPAPVPEPAAWRADALRFALERGSRSGRVAWQFARDWVGARGLESGDT
jgi:predicted AAA+ superfamily ATPase